LTRASGRDTMGSRAADPGSPGRVGGPAIEGSKGAQVNFGRRKRLTDYANCAG